MRKIILAAALSLIAVPAFAGAPWTATPVQPGSKSGFVADSVIWSCGASGCKSQSDTGDADPMSECQSLARQFGSLSAFTSGSPFTAARLAHCNEAAKK